MRNKNNLKRFGHASKNSEQRGRYIYMITGDQTRGGTVGDSELDSFDDTNRIEGQQIDAEEINTSKRPPYRSAFTVAQENWILWAVSGAVTFSCWVSYSIFNHYGDIRALDERTTSTNKEVESIQSDLKKVDERSIRNSILLENSHTNEEFTEQKEVQQVQQ